MGTIAVTGATGYLAEKLIERLITQGHTIHAIARNEGKLIALRAVSYTHLTLPTKLEV